MQGGRRGAPCRVELPSSHSTGMVCTAAAHFNRLSKMNFLIWINPIRYCREWFMCLGKAGRQSRGAWGERGPEGHAEMLSNADHLLVSVPTRGLPALLEKMEIVTTPDSGAVLLAVTSASSSGDVCSSPGWCPASCGKQLSHSFHVPGKHQQGPF